MEQNTNQELERDETKTRSILQVINAKTTMEGEGFLVHRAFPNGSLREFDPFLLLDEMGPIEISPGNAKGAPDHPHRGFETVTYMIDGTFEHKDSQGHSGKIKSGDVQWMTAGSGVIHSEMPEKEFVQKGGTLHGFQLWVNLPKKDKMMNPRYQELPSKKIPIVQRDGVQVKVIAGESMGVKAIIETRTPIMYLHFTIQPNAQVKQIIPQNYNAFAYVVNGEGLFGNKQISAHKEQIILFEQEGNEISIKASVSPLDVLLIAGIPLGEPVTRYGPFVMNTQDEINQAILDYNTGKMGKIDF
ncbi:pirin family protein [Candidatus Nitrosarchaeum limnium]|uniref:Pirin family protein n=1 Tax=Candidatus Nitrosarchaeum limnium BG20 TaxID=859192 RepID=S2EA24_9ARCH|nr:pirin family protein [Candidatus Nitrosarchaeum limnium]EPA06261.1 pirin family protein [Candidatus Nitrosarchaeum limnium BG20]